MTTDPPSPRTGRDVDMDDILASIRRTLSDGSDPDRTRQPDEAAAPGSDPLAAIDSILGDARPSSSHGPQPRSTGGDAVWTELEALLDTATRTLPGEVSPPASHVLEPSSHWKAESLSSAPPSDATQSPAAENLTTRASGEDASETEAGAGELFSATPEDTEEDGEEDLEVAETLAAEDEDQATFEGGDYASASSSIDPALYPSEVEESGGAADEPIMLTMGVEPPDAGDERQVPEPTTTENGDAAPKAVDTAETLPAISPLGDTSKALRKVAKAMRDEAARQAALRDAAEEAGVHQEASPPSPEIQAMIGWTDGDEPSPPDGAVAQDADVTTLLTSVADEPVLETSSALDAEKVDIEEFDTEKLDDDGADSPLSPLDVPFAETDDAVAPKVPARVEADPAEPDTVLELTETVSPPAPDPATPLVLTEQPAADLDTLVLQEVAGAVAGEIRSNPELSGGVDRALISTESRQAANDAFQALAHPDGEAAQKILAKAQLQKAIDDGTLDVLTRQTLRPMLAQWLDEHLPELVERMVLREITKAKGSTAGGITAGAKDEHGEP